MRSRLPSLRGIEAFINAAEVLSFRIAAERLHVTVSAVSHRIHALEEEMGLLLFDRKGRALSLTQAGAAYLDYLLPIVSELQQATQAVHNSTNSYVLRIASFHMFHAIWLAPRIARFTAQHPDAEIEMLTLRHRKLIHPDIAIRILPPGDMTTECDQLSEWRVSPICRPELIQRYGLRTPEDLAQARLIETAASLDAWPRWFEAAGLAPDMPRHSMISDSPALNVELVRLGVGVGIMADFLAEPLLDDGLVYPFDIACFYPGGIYVNRPASFERPIVKAFRNWLMAEVGSSLEKSATYRRSSSLERVA